MGLGYERENCHSNHGYILSLATWPILGMSLLLWLTSGLWGQLFSSSPIVLSALANPLVWAALGLQTWVFEAYLHRRQITL